MLARSYNPRGEPKLKQFNYKGFRVTWVPITRQWRVDEGPGEWHLGDYGGSAKKVRGIIDEFRPGAQNPRPKISGRVVGQRRRREARAARQLWREFREAPVGRSRRIKVEWPKALMVMGSVQLIAYVTTHGGKIQPYEHEFAPGSEPLLCAGKKRGQLFLIGEGFKVNAHGIVDIDRAGRRRRYTPRLKVVRRR